MDSSWLPCSSGSLSSFFYKMYNNIDLPRFEQKCLICLYSDVKFYQDFTKYSFNFIKKKASGIF